MLLLATLALALQPLADDRRSSDIVVHAPELQSTRAALDSVAPPLRAKDPVARFSDPICAASAGLTDAADHLIVDRVEELAASVGLRVGSPGCAPNVIIMFVNNGKTAVRRLLTRGSPGVASQSLDDMRRIIADPSPVKAWTETEIRSRDGDRPIYHIDKAPDLRVATSSIVSLPVRRDILSATVVIDRDAVAGRSLRQVADYAAVRALTGARPDPRLGQRSMLSLFAGGTAGSPQAATAFDIGYLHGLYDGRGDLPDMIKRAAIVQSIAKYEKQG